MPDYTVPQIPATEYFNLQSENATLRKALTHHCAKTVDEAAFIALTQKLATLTRSLQQIANLDPDSFNSANRAVSMAKTALLVPIPKK